MSSGADDSDTVLEHHEGCERLRRNRVLATSVEQLSA